MRKISSVIKYVFLSIIAFVSIFPFFWMIIGATNTTTDVTKGKITLGGELLTNLKNLVEMVDLPLVLWNSAKIAILTTLLSLLVASMAGYGFELYRHKLREKIYSFMLLTMMVPFAALMIPLFRLFAKAKMLDSHWAVILPMVSSIFVIFFFRQNTKSFPQELVQAARVDGLNELQIFFYIYMPTMKSTYAAASIIVFMTAWNNFLWPLIILQSQGKKTITLVISSLSSAYFPDFGVIMVAIIIATLPTILIFFLMQKRFVEGMLGSIK
jgi:lactose/L-arabinose transport system permease protein